MRVLVLLLIKSELYASAVNHSSRRKARNNIIGEQDLNSPFRGNKSGDLYHTSIHDRNCVTCAERMLSVSLNIMQINLPIYTHLELLNSRSFCPASTRQKKLPRQFPAIRDKCIPLDLWYPRIVSKYSIHVRHVRTHDSYIVGQMGKIALALDFGGVYTMRGVNGGR